MLENLTRKQIDMLTRLNVLTTEKHPDYVYIPPYKYEEMFEMKYSELMMILRQLEDLGYIEIKHWNRPGEYTPCQINLSNETANFIELLQSQKNKKLLIFISGILATIIGAIIIHMLGLQN